jgi:addiction module HigA family antidote
MSRAPTHPGAILREDVFPALNVSVSAAARELGITRLTLHRILSEQTSITPEMAVRLGKYCGNGPGLWLRLQIDYDLWQAEHALGRALKAIPNRSQAA